MTGPSPSSAPIDFQQLRAAQAEAAENPPAARAKMTSIVVKGESYPLVTEITPNDMIEFQDAQESGSFRELITVMPNIIADTHRELFRERIWAKAERDADRISFTDLLEQFNKATEDINARPLGK